MKWILTALVAVALLIAGFFALNSYIYNEKQVDTATDYKNAEYIIEGQRVKLQDGIAETQSAPGSASKSVTRYFGNEISADLDNDGREDVVFVLTQEGRGSGTFYYVVAALNTEEGYVGSEAYVLGDRIAPQSTELSQNPGHQNVIVVNYMDRAPGEPMTAQPSVGRSVWLKLDPVALQFGVVEQNFEGEADPNRMSLTMKTWEWVRAEYNDGTVVTPNRDVFTLTFKNDGTFGAATDCNGVGGKYTATESTIRFSEMVSTLMYCEGSQEADFRKILENTGEYLFTSKGELVLNLKFDSGSVYFR
ncbi:META domain-containing protein [Patescibacteria group bacterium]|nr:META domain-containing protein [Patescibacteria group bacterium]MBU1500685.1 META domain-containing protein [Patescibacteria group bacterium]MBU2080762.1 META domain-containing protein [Patescibacteria group bacterium]MBU2123867.1 META domain-containing protein [Patescibacteria group bacterium]MBU2194842.1 META domain-containing protein [Patescibacteria group bacterium]